MVTTAIRLLHVGAPPICSDHCRSRLLWVIPHRTCRVCSLSGLCPASALPGPLLTSPTLLYRDRILHACTLISGTTALMGNHPVQPVDCEN